MAFEDYKGAMFGIGWKSSARKYGVVAERDVAVPMSDGVRLGANLWKPDGGGRHPGILGFHCYHADGQTGPIEPATLRRRRGLVPTPL